MSDSYEYVVTCIFSPSLEPRLLATLGYLVRTHEYAFDAPPDHPFFLAEEEAEEGEAYTGMRHGAISCSRIRFHEDCGYFARFFRVQSSCHTPTG